MTIFTSIKYPISCPPTREELSALPRGLVESWALNKLQMTVNDEYTTNIDTIVQVLSIYYYQYPTHRHIVEDHLKYLRDEIYNLDEE